MTAYQLHSATSQRAAKKISRNGTDMKQKDEILYHLDKAGIHGLINQDLSRMMGIVPGTISARLIELENDERIIKTKKMRQHEGYDGHVYVRTHHYRESMGKAARKAIGTQGGFDKLKETLRRYALGLNDGGALAERVLAEFAPDDDYRN
ncbi:unnamed protein product [Sphagnum balticum]